MTEHVYTTLREANRVRQAEWDKDSQISLSYRGNELAGEVGEACNIIKKLERARLGIRGSRADVQDLAAELADVVICADLIAMAQGIDLDAAVAAKFNATSEKVGLTTRLEPDFRTAEEQAAIDLFEDLGCRLLRGEMIGGTDYARRCGEAIALLLDDTGLAAALIAYDPDAARCEACDERMEEGDTYFPDHNNGGVLHAECVGPEREGFTDGEGNPLAPDSPIPTPLTWSEQG